MIYDLKGSVHLRWLFDPVLHSFLDDLVFLWSRCNADPLMTPWNHLGFAPRLISPAPPTVAVTHLFSPSTFPIHTHLTNGQSTCFQNRSDLDCFQFDFGEACMNAQVHTSRGDEPVYTACLSPLCPPSVKPFTSTAFDRRRPTQTLPSSFHLCWVFIAKKSNNVIKVNPAIYKVFWNLLWMDWTHYE